MKFRVVNGPLITLARQAQESPENTFVLLIDEINRGNVPAVFGELYYLLEYRDRSVTLTYGETQALSRNLFIIGHYEYRRQVDHLLGLGPTPTLLHPRAPTGPATGRRHTATVP
jgi:hypothetical protein